MIERDTIWSPQVGSQHALVNCPFPEVFFGGARGGGKGVHESTLIPTSYGMKSMRDVKVGDSLFDADGNPCRVTEVSETSYRSCFKILFDDGNEIIADDVHRWLTHDIAGRAAVLRCTPEFRAARRAKRPSRALAASSKPGVSANVTQRNSEREYIYAEPPLQQMRTTLEIMETCTKERGALNHSIDIAPPFQGHNTDLPIEPYLFGLWLGDGFSDSGALGMMTEDLRYVMPHVKRPVLGFTEIIEGYNQSFCRVSFKGMYRLLGDLSVRGDKHIPMQYLRASVEQRKDLLQGIMDTDGSCEERGKCELSLSNRRLAEDVLELVCGLGIRARLSTKFLSQKSDKWADSHRMSFRATFPVFKLPRKYERQKLMGHRDTTRRRYIVSVTPVPTVPTRCISVDSPTHTYLVTRAFIATHNTDGVLGKWAVKEAQYGKRFNARMFRRTVASAEDAIERSKQIFGEVTGPFKPKFNEQSKTWRMAHGGRMGFAYLDSIADADNQQGKNITDAWIEEAGQYPSPAPIDKLFGALRSGDGVPIQMILTANPGGAGQHWISDRYKLIPFPRRPQVVTRILANGHEHKMAVIPSRITDNKLLMESDPQYINRLQLVGSAALVRAWVEGDWSAIEGAFFPEFSNAKHVVEPFKIPDHWMRFRSADWGSAKPFSIGWTAVVSDDTRLRSGQLLPRGALVRYREWYGASGINVGLKIPAETVGMRIREIEDKYEPKAADGQPAVEFGVIDPATFASDGGPSIAERMWDNGKGVMFRPADNKRTGTLGAMGGWDQLRARLIGTGRQDVASGSLDWPDGTAPMIFFFSTCRDSIRTLPALQHDRNRPEDCDSSAEDHAPDEIRYSCMARPYVRDLVIEPSQKYLADATLDEIWSLQSRRTGGRI